MYTVLFLTSRAYKLIKASTHIVFKQFPDGSVSIFNEHLFSLSKYPVTKNQAIKIRYLQTREFKSNYENLEWYKRKLQEEINSVSANMNSLLIASLLILGVSSQSTIINPNFNKHSSESSDQPKKILVAPMLIVCQVEIV